MKVAQKVKRKISGFPQGETFKYQQLGISRTEYPAAAKSIERLIKTGVVRRVTTGVFYKPKSSAFGEIKPGEEELLKTYLFENGKRIAYVTGVSLYNRMGLTTQIPKTIKVASRVKRVSTKIGSTLIKPVKSYVDVTNDNYPLLEILDALKDIKSIPDVNKKSAVAILNSRINSLSEKELSKMVGHAKKYPPRTRALLGAFLEMSGKNAYLETLKSTMNPFTKYSTGLDSTTLPTGPEWKIT